MYDFDRTLCTRDMQEFSFIPSLGMSAGEFWGAANELSRREQADGILAYMYTMLREAAKAGRPIVRDELVRQGAELEFFPGVSDWFGRINRYAAAMGVTVEHYVLSSGLREIIEGSAISGEFTRIFASEFLYDERGYAVWPKTAVNYTSKTQFIYRINKGILDISNDADLNRSTPEGERRVLFTNMLYIGDGLSDVPCMKMVEAYGGRSIALYWDGRQSVADDLLLHGRVSFREKADYSEGSGLETTVRNIILHMAAKTKLDSAHFEQVAQAGEKA
ncbi:MAG: haloacid dehalogenase-like hydrolase [Clostridia bacterium]|nr:haloacid dehalogenase-like hydrolase [Clostridia bacterium]